MTIWDPLYGRFEIAPEFEAILTSPELRRLTEIRLLNTRSVSLACLGELRRYSHTLGVLHLASQCRFVNQLGTLSRTAICAGALVHDIGTFSFGHLLEYRFRSSFGLDHESMASKILFGSHVPENTAHQIYRTQVVQLHEYLRQHHMLAVELRDVLSGVSPYSPLLFGQLDFDNIDNVYRMAWALGIRFDPREPVLLAKGMGVTSSGRMTLDQSCVEIMRSWATIRRRVYEILVFDAPTVAAQAVLTRAINQSLASGRLTQHDWYMTDEELLQVLAADAPNFGLFRGGQVVDDLQLIIAVQFRDLRTERTESVQLGEDLARALVDCEPRISVIPYVFEDNGAFEKRITYSAAESGEAIDFGIRSRSRIAYLFARGRRKIPRKNLLRALKSFMLKCEIDEEHIVRLKLNGEDASIERGLEL